MMIVWWWQKWWRDRSIKKDDNKVSDSYSNDIRDVIKQWNDIFESNFKKLEDKISEMNGNFNRRADDFINEMKKRNEKWERDRYK